MLQLGTIVQDLSHCAILAHHEIHGYNRFKLVISTTNSNMHHHLHVNSDKKATTVKMQFIAQTHSY